MRRDFWRVQSYLVARAETDAASDGGGGGDEAAQARDALEQRCMEQLLEDEALRADLTDDEFVPLQQWAEERLHERAAAIADPANPDAELEMARVVECLKGVLRPINDAVGHRAELATKDFEDTLARIIEALEPPLYPAEGPANEAEVAIESIVPRLAQRKDEAEGVELIDELVAALRDTHSPSGNA